MKHLVFDSFEAAQDRNAQAFADEMAAGLFVEGTNACAEVKHYPDGSLPVLVESPV